MKRVRHELVAWLVLADVLQELLPAVRELVGEEAGVLFWFVVNSRIVAHHSVIAV